MNMNRLYEKGRKRWQEDVAARGKSKREEQTLAHQRAVELQGMRTGEGSPAMIGAQSGRQIGQWEYGPGGVRPREATVKEGTLALAPGLAAAKWDIENRKLQLQGMPASPKRTDIQAIYKFEADDDFDASDPQSIAKANALREAAGMPLWVKGEDQKRGLGIPYISPSRTVPTYRQEGEEEYQRRIGQGVPSPTQPGQPITINQPPAAYAQPQGGGTMRLEGQSGYYGINVPGEGGTPISPGYQGIRRFGGKQLDQATAQEFLRQAGGDPEKARKMARDQGYVF